MHMRTHFLSLLLSQVKPDLNVVIIFYVTRCDAMHALARLKSQFLHPENREALLQFDR